MRTCPASVLCTAAAIIGCAAPASPVQPATSTDRASPTDVLAAELARGAGVARLIEYSGADQPLEIRLLALRGLGRVGEEADHWPLSRELSARASATLLDALEHEDARIRARAAQALGVSQYRAAEPALLARLERETDADTVIALLHALGRLGSARALPEATARLSQPAFAGAAAHALGNLGIRGHALDVSARRALVRALEFADAGTHLAVAFALEREHRPPEPGRDDAGVVDALRALAGHASAEVRATALRALERRRTGLDLMLAALEDSDWRVRVRAAAGAASLLMRRPGDAAADLDAVQDAGARLSTKILAEWQALAGARFEGPGAHVITQALSNLQAVAEHPDVARLADTLYRDAAEILARDPGPSALLLASTVHCLSAAVRVRARVALQDLVDCGGDQRRGMPMAERRALFAGYAAEAAESPVEQRWSVLRQLAHDEDARVRARTIAVLPAFAGRDRLPDDVRSAVIALLANALGDPETDVAGSAAGAIVEMLAFAGTGGHADAGLGDALHAAVREPLLARARRLDSNLELAVTWLDALAALRAPEAAILCGRARSHGNRTVREHARACSRALGQPDTAPDTAPIAAADPATPPAAITDALLGARPLLVLDTSKGEIRIRLLPEIAPFHVAAIASLAERGFYRDLMWHRVVPDFVVQGGDPTGSGWGGPDFVLPAEPWWREFSRGAVGVADAGLDTGGSQLFIMHSRAHRLDGRYTLIGHVIEGQDVADSLLVGDRILGARIESR